MNQIKLLMSDIDETILKINDEISEKDQETVERLLDIGVEVVWTTGRYFDTIPDYFTKNPRINYIASSNGAVIHDLNKGEIILNKSLEHKYVLEIMDALDHKASHVFIDTDWGAYIDDRILVNEIEEESGFFDLLIKHAKKTDDLHEFIKEKKLSARKIELAFDDLKFRDMAYAKLKKSNRYKVSATHHTNIDVISIEASKGNALVFMQEKLGLEKQETLAIGDNDNDASMIKNAGLGIAMGNGTILAKETADYVTDTIENSGFSQAMKKTFNL